MKNINYNGLCSLMRNIKNFILQGEMLRMAEKLRNEAVDNGNYARKYAIP
jgi:hypothetical protein